MQEKRRIVELVVTADDFGATPGTIKAVQMAFKAGGLSRASLPANCQFFDDAVSVAKELNIPIGVHLNLTMWNSLSNTNGILTNTKGCFNKSFLKLLCLPLFYDKNRLEEIVEIELESQFNRIIRSGLQPVYIDGHQHVHIIPWVRKVVDRLAQKHGIDEIRSFNESLWHTFMTRKRAFFKTGLFKYMIVRTIDSFNKKRGDTYFFSMVHSCNMKKSLFDNLKVPKKYSKVEVMLHPSFTDNYDHNSFNMYYRTFMKSNKRLRELEAAIYLAKLKLEKKFIIENH